MKQVILSEKQQIHFLKCYSLSAIRKKKVRKEGWFYPMSDVTSH